MKLTLAENNIEVPVQGRRFKTLEPGTYTAIIKEIEQGGYKGRVYLRDEKTYLKDDQGNEVKHQYVTYIPDIRIQTDEGEVEVSRESFVVGTLINKQIARPHPSSDLIWFGSGGAGYLMTTTGIIQGGNIVLEHKDVRDVVVKVKTGIAGFIPRPRSKNFNPIQLNDALKAVNDGQDYDFADLDHLVLRYNLINGYTVITDAEEDGATLYGKENASDVTREVYAIIMQSYREGEAFFVDTFEADDEDDEETSGVRLKTKTVIRSFYQLSASEAGDDYYRDPETGVTYVDRATADAVGTAGGGELSGW